MRDPLSKLKLRDFDASDQHFCLSFQDIAMGLLDDLDELISSSQKAKTASSSNTTLPILGAKSSTKQKHTSNEKLGCHNTWSLSQLQDEAKRYGFRASNDRKAMLKQLKEVQEALERQKEEHLDEEGSVAEVSMSDLTMEMIKQANEKSGDVMIEDESHSDCEDEDDEVPLARRINRKATASSQNSTASPTAIAPSLSSQLYNAITSDKSLYHRILLFEPVSFDEISSTAKRAGVTGLKNKETLRNWLDMQGICFYTAELSGQRQRY